MMTMSVSAKDDFWHLNHQSSMPVVAFDSNI